MGKKSDMYGKWARERQKNEELAEAWKAREDPKRAKRVMQDPGRPVDKSKLEGK